MVIKICEQCGKEFTANPPNKKYCCKFCASEAVREQQRIRRAKERKNKPKEGREVICVQCGKPFIAYNQGIRKYCSEECVNKVRSEREKNRYLKERKKIKNGETITKQKNVKKYKLHKCWTCFNAVPNPTTGAGCSWSKDRIPVCGWEALNDEYKYNKKIIKMYTVLDCPEYVRG